MALDSCPLRGSQQVTGFETTKMVFQKRVAASQRDLSYMLIKEWSTPGFAPNPTPSAGRVYCGRWFPLKDGLYPHNKIKCHLCRRSGHFPGRFEYAFLVEDTLVRGCSKEKHLI